MTVIKNVAIVGATGNLGPHIIKALHATGKFNITSLKRSSSTSSTPAGVKEISVDFSSVPELTTALKGQDALIIAVGFEAQAGQKALVDACVAAGVYRILPAEFGSNLDNALCRKSPVFATKVEIQEYVKAAIAKGSALTYTFVYNGAFIDWGIDYDFVIKTSDGKPMLIDGGDLEFSATSLESVGVAVAGVLSHPEETKNRAVYISDMVTTQNKLLAIAKKVAPQKDWQPFTVSMEDIVNKSNERLKQGLYDMETFGPYIYQACYSPGYGGKFEKTDNELLGIKGKTDADVEPYFRKHLKV